MIRTQHCTAEAAALLFDCSTHFPMNSLYVFVFAYALCSLALFIADWEPGNGRIDFAASALIGITWPLWVLVRFFLILKMNP